MSTSKPQGQPAKVEPVIKVGEVDSVVNALYSAYCSDMGSPFKAGGSRNYRGIVSKWNPLQKYAVSPDAQSTTGSMGPEGLQAPSCEFVRDYLLSHFFDRFFYADEASTGWQTYLEVEAWNKFHANIERGWLFDGLSPLLLDDPWLSQVLREAKHLCFRALGCFDKIEVFEQCHHGPNSTVGIENKKAYLGTKYLTFVGSDDCQELFAEYLRWDSTLGNELGTMLPDPNRMGVVTCDSSTLMFVDKSWKSRRAITPQPNLMLFFQLGTGAVLAERLKTAFGIDIQTQQECHRHLVRFASAHPDAGICTLDWSEASNRIWLWLCEAILPKDWFDWFLSIRTPTTSYKGNLYDLPFIGEMGNGFTFPLQTLLFYLVLRSIARTDNIPDGEFVSVFGDDCIVDAGILPGVRKFASMVGWTLNEEKTFVEGWFRESCGADCYAGEGCRPFMVRRPERRFSKSYLRAWSYSVYNGIQRTFSGRWDLFHVRAWLEKFHQVFELGRICVVPPRFGDASGIRCEAHEVALLDSALYHIPVLYDGERPNKYGGSMVVRGIASHQSRYTDWVFPYYHLVLRRYSTSSDQLDPGPEEGLSMRDDRWYGTGVPIACSPEGAVASRDPECLSFRERSFHLHTWRYWLDTP